jgi:hypothetical protein
MSLLFERILLATEHTEFDTGAERVAFELARHHGLALAGVLPIVSNAEYEAVAPELAARAESEAHAKLENLRTAAAAAGVTLVMNVRRGDEPYREIIAEAERCHADLVVARRRGQKGFLANLMVGEMVGKVATLAPCSVLLAPRAARLWSRRVLAAVDRSAGAAAVAATAARIAVGFDIPLLIASVAAEASARETVEAAVATAATMARAAGAKVEGRVLAGRPAERISALAAEVEADLLVVGRRGETRTVRRFLLGGTAQQIVGLAHCPVLIVKT